MQEPDYCRVSLNLILVIACIPIELAQTFNQIFTDKTVYSSNGRYSANFYLNLVQGVFIYTLFYQVCILGPIDMAKVYMLRDNQKVIGIFYCIMCGFSVCFQALFLE